MGERERACNVSHDAWCCSMCRHTSTSACTKGTIYSPMEGPHVKSNGLSSAPSPGGASLDLRLKSRRHGKSFFFDSRREAAPRDLAARGESGAQPPRAHD